MQNQLSRAILVNVVPHDRDKTEAMAEFDELMYLVQTYGGMVILKIIQKRGRPSAKTFVGEGKAMEIAALVRQLKADVVVINGFLKANQSNHLINIIPCEVLDRFEMILKIFEKHAKTPEAKLQLQIAQHKYEFPKLFGKGAFLSQQAAGMGVNLGGAGAGRRAARGPGEKVLEVKRRHLKQQIFTLERKLEQFRKVRELQRQRRRRENFRTVALVGYTNSGKSSLMRALTKKENIVVENKLFSTLDTRLGNIGNHVLMADTIGFMQNLPPLLFGSFLATLEEVKEADLLVHVIDASDPKVFEKMNVVDDVLAQLECDTKPRLLVFNKIDLVSDEDLAIFAETFKELSPSFVSALRQENFEGLLTKIEQTLKIAPALP
jgi:GTP-binding protein HflX